MPQKATLEPNNRKQVSQQETFRYTTPNIRPTARRVDAYAAPAMSTNAQALLESISGVISAGRGLSTALVGTEEDKKKGMVAAAQGKPKVLLSTAKWSEGYKQWEGEADASDFEAEIAQDYLDKGMSMSTEQWAGYVQSKIGERVSQQDEAYAAGFLTKAEPAMNKWVGKHSEDLYKTQKNEALTNAGKIALDHVTKVIDNPGIKREDWAKTFRYTLSSLQRDGKSMGLTRAEVTATFLKVVGEQAVARMEPDLMSFITEQDETGNSLVNDPALADSAYAYTKEAENSRRIFEENAARKAQQIEKQMTEQLERNIVVQMLQKKDLGQLKLDLMSTFSQPQIVDGYSVALTSEKLLTYGKYIDELRKESSFAATSHPGLYSFLDEKASRGALSLEALVSNQGYLAKDDFYRLLERNNDRKVRAEDDHFKGYEKKSEQLLSDWTSVMDSEGGTLMKKYDTHRGERLLYFKRQFRELQDQLVTEKSQGDQVYVPTQLEMNNHIIQAKKFAYEMFPLEGTGPTPGGASSQQTGQNEKARSILNMNRIKEQEKDGSAD